MDTGGGGIECMGGGGIECMGGGGIECMGGGMESHPRTPHMIAMRTIHRVIKRIKGFKDRMNRNSNVVKFVRGRCIGR